MWEIRQRKLCMVPKRELSSSALQLHSAYVLGARRDDLVTSAEKFNDAEIKPKEFNVRGRLCCLGTVKVCVPIALLGFTAKEAIIC